MHLPPLPPPINSQVYVNGDVSIDASAAIAPGAIVQADPDSKIIIAAGVCIGMGVILHAHKGTLEVEAGANLGAGVLVVGSGKIGANACIGAATTIWNSSVEPWQVVPPGSLLGDTGRTVATTTTENVPATESAPAAEAEDVSLALQQPPKEDALAQKQPESLPPAPGVPVSGKDNLNRLLLTLFPHQKSAALPQNDNNAPNIN
jgi:carbon dioxide concentrating mechanism protein CcmN